MKQKIFFSGLGAACFIFCLAPSVTSAASPIEQTVTKLRENTYLFTLTYPFSFLGYEVKMPMLAARGIDYNASSSYMGYNLFHEDGTPLVGGESLALILSDALLSGNTYEVTEGKQTNFTLIALVKLPPASSQNSDRQRIYLGVTKLPFTLVKAGKELPSQLDQKQLEPYRTHSIER